MNRQERGKLIISAAKSLKDFRLADPRIALYLYGTLAAGRLGLFVSAIKSEERANINRIRFLAAEEGIDPRELKAELLPWLETAGICEIERTTGGEPQNVTSLVLAYDDLLGAVSDFYDSRDPSNEDRGCLSILAQGIELPEHETVVMQTVSQEFGEEVANTAFQLAKAYKIVATSGIGEDPLVYAPRVWSGLHPKASQALSPLDTTDREIVLHLVNRVKSSQGYPESLFRSEANQHGAEHLVDLVIGIGLVNRTELYVAKGAKRAFLTTPSFLLRSC